MKVLIFNEFDVLLLPDGINNLEDFIKYANEHYNELIPMYKLIDDNCVYPYYIKEDTKLMYYNISKLSNVTEDDVEIVPKNEYTERLNNLVNKICINCIHYTEELEGDNLKGHWNNMCLNGICGHFEKKTDDNVG